MLSGDKFCQHFQDGRPAEPVRDDNIKEAVIGDSVRYGFHAAAEPAAVSDREDGHFLLLRFSVQRDLDRERAEFPQGGKDPEQVGKKSLAEPLEAGSLPEHFHIETRTGNIHEIHVVEHTDINFPGGA